MERDGALDGAITRNADLPANENLVTANVYQMKIVNFYDIHNSRNVYLVALSLYQTKHHTMKTYLFLN
jgi:hypothetical protein